LSGASGSGCKGGAPVGSGEATAPQERLRRAEAGRVGNGPGSISMAWRAPGTFCGRRKEAVKLVGCDDVGGATVRGRPVLLLIRTGGSGPGAASAKIPRRASGRFVPGVWRVPCSGTGYCGPGFCSMSPQVRRDPRPWSVGLSAVRVSGHVRMCWPRACVSGGEKEIPQRVQTASLP